MNVRMFKMCVKFQLGEKYIFMYGIWYIDAQKEICDWDLKENKGIIGSTHKDIFL